MRWGVCMVLTECFTGATWTSLLHDRGCRLLWLMGCCRRSTSRRACERCALKRVAVEQSNVAQVEQKKSKGIIMGQGLSLELGGTRC